MAGTRRRLRRTDNGPGSLQLDDRYGGGHARQALVQYLATDAGRMLNGKYTDTVGRALLAAVCDATRLAAWMAYDSAPASALAQGYYVQALALAQAAGDRLLGAGILAAMSHQATFTGRYTEAATLARAALNGTTGIATPTLTAHFHAMEARALARLHDSKACGHALAEATRAFERADPQNDPQWFQYFDESELSAELGHCMRDLGRAADAVQPQPRRLPRASRAVPPPGRSRRGGRPRLASWRGWTAGRPPSAGRTAGNATKSAASARC